MLGVENLFSFQNFNYEESANLILLCREVAEFEKKPAKILLIILNKKLQ